MRWLRSKALIVTAASVGNSASLAVQSEASSIEATKCCLHFGIAGEFAALGLRQTLKDCRQVRGIDRLRLAVACGEPQHGASDFVLGVRRQTAHRFEGTLQELGH